MAPLVRHVEEPRPVVEMELTPNAGDYQLLSTAKHYAVQWALDDSLFAQPSGRSASNFYPLNLADASGFSRYQKAVYALPWDVWDYFTQDSSQRRLYWRFGAGYQLDPNHDSWAWSSPMVFVLNHDPRADAGPEISAPLSGGTLQGDAELYGGDTTDPDPNTDLTYNWQLIDAPEFDPSKSAHRSFVDAMAERVANASGPRVTAVPQGASVPAGVQGTYQFHLEVVDDDKSTFYGNKGRDTDTTTLRLGDPPSADDVRVTDPTTDRQAFVERPEQGDVTIEYEIDPSLYRELERQHGFFLMMVKISHAEDPQGKATYIDVSRSKPSMRGEFTWHLYDVEGLKPDPGPYDIYLSLVGENGWSQLSVQGYSTSTTEEKALYLDPYQFWADLVSFRPPVAVQRSLHNDSSISSGQFQPIEDGSGPVNLDYYPVRIESFPSINGSTLLPSELLEYVRLNLNAVIGKAWAYLGSTTFTPWNSQHRQTWESASPVGAFLFLDLVGPDNASLVCTAHGQRYWRFSTTYTSSTYNANPVLSHPVSGNREWGIFGNDDGSYTFYTRAADRTTDFTDPSFSYSLGDQLWQALQRGVAKTVNNNGGQATVEAPVAIRPPWSKLESCCHQPNRPWVYQ